MAKLQVVTFFENADFYASYYK